MDDAHNYKGVANSLIYGCIIDMHVISIDF